jgi:hypothetical protein
VANPLCVTAYVVDDVCGDTERDAGRGLHQEGSNQASPPSTLSPADGPQVSRKYG